MAQDLPDDTRGAPGLPADGDGPGSAGTDGATAVPDAGPADAWSPPAWWVRLRDLPTAARWTAYAAAALVLVLVVGLVTVTALVRRPFPQVSGTVEVPGLTGEVEVVRDEYGVPQIYADSMADLMRAQGYVHAQERFFQMDVRRHLTAGRLAELFGEPAVETDSYIRTMGWRRVASRELALVAPDTRAALQAYADGVNAYLDEHSPSELSVEYTLLAAGGLDYRPERWTPVDSLAWLKAIAWDLAGNLDVEVGRVLAGADHTAEEVEQLYPPYPYDAVPPIVDQGAVVDGVFEQDATEGGTRNPERPAYTADQRRLLARVAAGLDRLPESTGRGDGVGSNSWVVDGEHSATGQPILANDPHLGVGLPGVWMQAGLHCRTVSEDCPMDVAGFTFAGVPGVVIGHNRDIAWGFTNLGPDVTDLYLEKVVGDRWRYAGRLRPLRTRTETIRVEDGEDVELTVRSTAHGPLLSDVDEQLAEVGRQAETPYGLDRGDGFGVALAWTGLRPSRTADALLRLNLATDWTDFRAAAEDFALPAQNLIYADTRGHIGYQAPGYLPIRKSGNDGGYPSAGWRPENDWTGESVPFEGLPTLLDPEEGVIVTANQAVAGPDYPYYLSDDFDQGYRAQRIRDLLRREGELSMAETAELQLDDRNPMAPTLVPYLLDVPALGSAYYEDGRDLLRRWSYRQPADSAAAAYYNVVWADLLELTFHDDLPEEAWPDGGQRWMAVVTGLLADPGSSWWDDTYTEDVVETRDDILVQALRDGRDDMTRLVALNPREWSWGKLHQLDLRQEALASSGSGVAQLLLNRDDYEVAGGGASVNATAWDAREGFEVASAPSMRMVVSLADFDDSLWVNLTGVSGHAFSDHYVDQTEVWVAGELLPWAFGADAVAAAEEETLTLVPESG